MISLMKIIGITGTNASWKGTIVDYLVQHKQFVHYSVRSFLIQELEKRGLPVDRDQMRDLANELRANYGASYIIEQLYLQAKEKGENAIIESIRAVGEVEKLKQYDDFLLLAVDADQQQRYQRILQRGSETDHVSFEEFQIQESKEMANTDPAKQNISSCMKMADIMIYNNGTFEDLYQQLDELFE